MKLSKVLLTLVLVALLLKQSQGNETGFYLIEEQFYPGFSDSELDSWNVTTTNNGTSPVTSHCGNTKLAGGFNLFGPGAELSRTLTNLTNHTEIMVSFVFFMIDDYTDDNQFQVYLDDNLEFEATKPVQCILDQMCGIETKDFKSAHSITLNHTADTLDLRFTSNLPESSNTSYWGIANLNIQIMGECEGEIVGCNCVTKDFIERCSDNLEELLPNENGTWPITNICEPVPVDVGGGEVKQGFEFTVKFLEGYQFDEDCLDLRVKFEDKYVQQGQAPLDQWYFDAGTQEIQWTILLDDFEPVYGCSLVEDVDGKTYVWMCDFSTTILFNGQTQVVFNAKIKVTLNREAIDTLPSVDIQRNLVTGECCENEFNIQTEIQWCEDQTCQNILTGTQTLERNVVKYLQIQITTSQFDHYYLKLLQIKLGILTPDVVFEDFSQPGKVILGIKTNIVISGLQILDIITQVHLEQPTLRFLSESLRKDQKLRSFDQIQIIDNEGGNKENIQGQDKQSENETVKKIIKQDADDQKLKNLVFIIGSILGLSVISTISYIIYSYRKNKLKGGCEDVPIRQKSGSTRNLMSEPCDKDIIMSQPSEQK